MPLWVLCQRLVNGLGADVGPRQQQKSKGSNERMIQMPESEYTMHLAPLVCTRGMLYIRFWAECGGA